MIFRPCSPCVDVIKNQQFILSNNKFNYAGFLLLNTFIIEEHISDKRIRDFAYFLLAKSKYQNSVMYNYNVTKASKQWGVNRVLVRKYFKKFINLGWCKMDDGNLHFVHTNRTVIWRLKSYSINLNLGENAEIILMQLKHVILKRTQERFEWNKKVCMDRQNQPLEHVKEDEFDEALNYIHRGQRNIHFNVKKAVIDVYEKCHFFISFSKISKLLNCSISMAKKTIDQMVDSGLIRVFKKEMGFSRYWKPRFSPSDNKNKIFEGRPGRGNWCNFKEFIFPNSYIF